MRTPITAGNWKMHTTLAEAVSLVESMLGELDGIKGVEKVICPPFISLAAVSELLKGGTIGLGAQNVFYEEKGAFTGEISPLMLAGLCQYVIIGHSERRQYFGEAGEMLTKKIQAALRAGLKPIFCIGENLEENEAGQTRDVLDKQLTAASERAYFTGGLIIAYEPVWAIGTGKSATGQEANDTIGYIRRVVSQRHGADIAESVRILYGGSVTAGNIAEFMRQPEIDGALVGGASLKADEFLSITRQTAEIRGSA